MSFLLSSQNVHSYLQEKELCDDSEFDPTRVELKFAKNFNLLLTLRSERMMLLKQERHIKNGKTAGEFLQEWRVQELISHFPELSPIHYLFPEIIHFDPKNSIISFNYLDSYRDLSEFYLQGKVFPPEIAREIGSSVASIHRLTLGRSEYRDFLLSSDTVQNNPNGEVPAYFNGIGQRITPEIFSSFSSDGLKYLSLYQRYDSLEKSIVSLSRTYDACCLVHQDFKLNNLLLHNDWEKYISDTSPKNILRFIDWERSGWGDPASDLGSVVASYLQIWLGSLIVSSDTTLEESLRMAIIPLETLQPSLNMLINAYLINFPEILLQQPSFIQKVVQFAGIAIIQQIQSTIQYQKVFNNTGICMLQVAKSFLCRPEQSVLTVFGESEKDLISNSQSQLVSV